MTKLTQWEWERAVAKEATEKQLPQAAQWKRHQHHPAISPQSVSTLVPSSGVQATPAPARCSAVERRGGCTVFWLPARKHVPAS
jgi:hypothetical protein